jgi:hypothetical protein
MCVDREAFGRARSLEWKPATDAEAARRILAARIQHDVAFRVLRRIRERNLGLAAYARKAGTSYDRATKIFRGEAIMRLEDIAMAELILGQIITSPDGL